MAAAAGATPPPKTSEAIPTDMSQTAEGKVLKKQRVEPEGDFEETLANVSPTPELAPKQLSFNSVPPPDSQPLFGDTPSKVPCQIN